jgi:hypothetical protein
MDTRWSDLLANDPITVLATVDHLFAERHNHALAVNCEGDELTVVVIFPDVDSLLPSRQPYVTPGGKLSERQWSQTSRNATYLLALTSHCGTVIRESFACAPRIGVVQIAVVSPLKAPGRGLGVLFRTRFSREECDRFDWTADAVATPMLETADAELNLRGRAREVSPIPLDDEWSLFIDVVDITMREGGWLGPDDAENEIDPNTFSITFIPSFEKSDPKTHDARSDPRPDEEEPDTLTKDQVQATQLLSAIARNNPGKSLQDLISSRSDLRDAMHAAYGIQVDDPTD